MGLGTCWEAESCLHEDLSAGQPSSFRDDFFADDLVSKSQNLAARPPSPSHMRWSTQCVRDVPAPIGASGRLQWDVQTWVQKTPSSPQMV